MLATVAQHAASASISDIPRIPTLNLNKTLILRLVRPFVKLDSRDTPPSLHHSPATSDLDRTSTAEPTPVGTPRGFDAPSRRRSEKEKEKDLLFSWHRRAHGSAGNPNSYVDSTLLECDFEDPIFPLFGDPIMTNMANSTPIDIATSSSRHNQASNLTSALQSTTGNEMRPTQAMSIVGADAKMNGFGNGRDSLTSAMAGVDSRHGSGAQPISMNREKPRRESLAGSMVGGMSWGGVSVSSWVRDDIIMEGSSPFPYQSPSYHSSSYLPKLEANFMKDFRCCGLTLPSTHELLQHYEENHAQQMPASRKSSTQPNSDADCRKASAGNPSVAARSNGGQQDQGNTKSSTDQTSATAQRSSAPTVSRNPPRPAEDESMDLASTQFPAGQDMDGLQDMEMDMDDDSMAPSNDMRQQQYLMQDQPRITQRFQFGQPSPRVPHLELNTSNMGNHLQQHQGLRNSTPTTPVAPGRNAQFYQHNPTVSSVNTPTLSAHPRQQPQQYAHTPDSSAPGTPGELDHDFVGNYRNMNVGNQQFMQNQYQSLGGYHDFGNGRDMLDLCIDEPAKRLFQYNGGQKPAKQTPSASQLGDGQYGENSELARTIREQQRIAGVPDPQTEGGVPKPFHCPVIGCEKAYKNQNGLKYHKAHGHNSQQLAANDNGTFSIVDPETLNPYPGTLGMEKHKPYRCEVCGKRYKNLNGLKYHKNHSPMCDTENKGRPNLMMDTSNTSSAAMSGAALSNIGEEMQL